MRTMADFVLSEANQREIDRWIAKYPAGKQQSAVVQALFLAQAQNGNWLSESAMQAVAEYLQLPPIVVFEVATFYDLFNLQPIGKHKISLCTNVPCQLRGSDALVACLRERLGIGLGETTPDGRFTVREVECMAACVGAPMCQIDDRNYHEHLTPEKLCALIDDLDLDRDLEVVS